MTTTRSGGGGGVGGGGSVDGNGVRQRKTKASAAAAAAEQTAPQVEEVDTSEAEEIEREREEVEAERVRRKSRTPKQKVEDEDDDYTPWIDILRVITFLIFASCALSYLVSSGETFTWGMKHPPKYLRTDWWKEKFRGPIYLTLAELATYDGTDETKPLYLAINGTIYDVSSNRRTYGPGGSYRFFAGADAARSYVTGCFAEDRTPDMRGAEEMYLPLDDPEVDAHWTAAELAALKARERADALRRVHDGLLHWVKFFENSPRYPKVGYVKHPKDWLASEPRKTLCKSAAKGRTKRTIPTE
ncbi:putative cytochrome b5-like heme steroid binding domain-containing protein [Rosellinia necatrix]|uniref:Putative cytochrome b5-like heme steroid binding domain-containing protein n=1 Tax=Rosellinia necatrix TaxID=77044 RepID=A0A1W2TL14_ROSNE|nr:putative cytochrome b5-like heme steroid binding domain-containing protein [Rosellinia necatrix]